MAQYGSKSCRLRQTIAFEHETEEALDNGGINVTTNGVSNSLFVSPLKPRITNIMVMQADAGHLKASTVDVKATVSLFETVIISGSMKCFGMLLQSVGCRDSTQIENYHGRGFGNRLFPRISVQI